MPDVTIIIPCYQQESLISETIDSALNQTHAHVEVIVVNDGSTDGSHEIISSYGNRIRYINKANEGVSKTRNRGAEVAMGKYLIFLDGDDILHPQAVENHLKAFDDDVTELSILNHSIFSGVSPTPLHEDAEFFNEKALPGLFINNPYIPSTGMCKRSAFERTGGFQLSTWGCEDWAFAMSLAITSARPESYVIKKSTSTGVFYRKTDENRTKQHDGMLKSLADFYQFSHQLIIPDPRLLELWGKDLNHSQRYILTVLIAQGLSKVDYFCLVENIKELANRGFDSQGTISRTLEICFGLECCTKLRLFKYRLFDKRLFQRYARKPFFC